jgi:predicted enzyme related to lactoylglutathione lyase
MHKSRLAGFIVDCHTEDLEGAAQFWAEALGAPAKHQTEIAESQYVALDMPADEPYVEVQKVTHPSRVHIDIESDDIPAEVARLEALGAIRIDEIRGWVVMEAPTGQRFCVVPVVSAEFESRANTWE